jgi:hypothetical protein
MEHLKFNLNNVVLVKLTGIGYQRLADLWNRFLLENPGAEKSLGGARTFEYYRDRADDNGYTRFQAWEFMKQFGEVIYMGGRKYFDLDILIQKKHLREI